MQEAGHILAGNVLADAFVLTVQNRQPITAAAASVQKACILLATRCHLCEKGFVADQDRHLPAAAALLETEVAVLPFCALSEMPFTMRTIAMLYSRRITSSDTELVS